VNSPIPSATATLNLGGGTQGTGVNPSGVTQLTVPNMGMNTGLNVSHSNPMLPALDTNWPNTPVNNAPPNVSMNPSASASTIPGAVQGTNPDWLVPSVGNPLFKLGGLGGGSTGNIGDPNGMGGGGPMILTVHPSGVV
jgi:hypothetical protein